MIRVSVVRPIARDRNAERRRPGLLERAGHRAATPRNARLILAGAGARDELRTPPCRLGDSRTRTDLDGSAEFFR